MNNGSDWIVGKLPEVVTKKDGRKVSRWYWVTLIEHGKAFVTEAQVMEINGVKLWYNRDDVSISHIGSGKKVVAYREIFKPKAYKGGGVRENRKTDRKA